MGWALGLASGGGKAIEEKFERGLPPEIITANFSNPDFSSDDTPNTIFNTHGTSGLDGRGVFSAAGRTGNAATRAGPDGSGEQFGVSILGYWVNDYVAGSGETPNVGPEPQKGDLTVSAWYRIVDTGDNATYNLMTLYTRDLSNDNGSSNFDSGAVIVSYNPFAISEEDGVNAEFRFRAPNWNTDFFGDWLLYQFTIPLGVWVNYRYTYKADGKVQMIAETEAGVVLMDTTLTQGVAGWTPYIAYFNVMNYNGSQYWLDDVLIKQGSPGWSVDE